MSFIFLPVALLFSLIGIASFAFWVWMLFDCLSRKEEDFPNRSSNEKLIWTLVIIFASAPGALVYLFMVRLNASRDKLAATDGDLGRKE